MLNTPILFLIFNRPNLTAEVFQTIKQIQPKYLFIAADGPRQNVEGEELVCQQTRDNVLQYINWDCEVHTLLRNENLGCKAAVSQAITWFFDNVETGIILEDDCLPNKSFFGYCELMLDKYRNDQKITMISGSNHLFDEKYNVMDGYFFSTYCNIWGWATWRRVINNVKWNININEIKSNKLSFITYLQGSKTLGESFYGLLTDVAEGKFNTWDILFFYSLYRQNGINIFPLKNLITNIGVNGTHASNDRNITLLRKSTLLNLNDIHSCCSEYQTNTLINKEMLLNIEKIVSPKRISRFQTILYKVKNLFKD